MKRTEIRRDIMTALHYSRRLGRSDEMFVEAIVDRIIDLANEHERQVTVLKATFEAELDVMRREFATVKQECNDFKFGKTTNVIPLR
jgi:hypothetical protein